LTIMASAFTGYQFMQTQSITPVNSYEQQAIFAEKKLLTHQITMIQGAQ